MGWVALGGARKTKSATDELGSNGSRGRVGEQQWGGVPWEGNQPSPFRADPVGLERLAGSVDLTTRRATQSEPIYMRCRKWGARAPGALNLDLMECGRLYKGRG